MIVSVGYLKSSSQIFILDYEWNDKTSSRIIDVTDLVDQNLQGLYFDKIEDLNAISHMIEKEKLLYPIIDAQAENLTFSKFETLNKDEFKQLYLKLSNRWLMAQNLKTIENNFSMTNHLRDLWKKDRITFFEELWFWLKRNLGTIDLTIYFNDVIKTEEKDDNNEKKERPKLSQSYLKGEKQAHFQLGGIREKELMNSYIEKFHDIFEITEFNSDKAQFVATAQIDKSPIIIMGHCPQLNSLQRSLLLSVFSGIQF
jgi:hypothetical protein